jgi:Zn finger protein HypA/HybF involved in hydrogenase expression
VSRMNRARDKEVETKRLRLGATQVITTEGLQSFLSAVFQRYISAEHHCLLPNDGQQWMSADHTASLPTPTNRFVCPDCAETYVPLHSDPLAGDGRHAADLTRANCKIA